MYDNCKWRVNFWSNGDVVTNEGEIIGTWELLDGASPSFTPIGEDKPLLHAQFTPQLSEYVAEWLDAGGELVL